MGEAWYPSMVTMTFSRYIRCQCVRYTGSVRWPSVKTRMDRRLPAQVVRRLGSPPRSGVTPLACGSQSDLGELLGSNDRRGAVAAREVAPADGLVATRAEIG